MTRFDAPFKPTDPVIRPLSVKTPHIVAWFERKRPRAIESWQELGAEEYARAFTASRTAGSDIVRDLYDGFMETLRDEGGEDEFVNRVLPVLKQKGWLPDLDDDQLGSRVRLIYDTNIRTAQSVGKWRQAQRTKEFLPYIRYSAVMDSRTRPSHAALHGLIRPVDDPIWEKVYPPCGFRCRCVAVQATRSQAARWGGVTSDERAQQALALAESHGDLWGYNVGMIADQVQAEVVESANARRMPGAPVISASPVPGASFWTALFTQKIASLLEDLFAKDDK